MKTLEQLEPQTPIAATPCSITNSGSYYLTANLSYTGGIDGISIDVDNVTLDLGAFAVFGGGGSGTGIKNTDGRTDRCIRNGTVARWLARTGFLRFK